MKRSHEDIERREHRLEQLDDYVRGGGMDAEASAFEEDLFERAMAGNARELVAYDWLVATFRQLGDRGTFMNFMTRQDATTMRSRYGDRLYYLEVLPGDERRTIVIPRTAELFLTRTPLDLRGIERLDLEAHVEGVGLVKTMPDVTFDPADDALWGCCEGELARQTVGMPILTKYWGTSSEGRRLVGQVLAMVEIG